MKDLRSSMFNVVVFTLANWKEPEYPPVGDWVKPLSHSHTIGSEWALNMVSQIPCLLK